MPRRGRSPEPEPDGNDLIRGHRMSLEDLFEEMKKPGQTLQEFKEEIIGLLGVLQKDGGIAGFDKDGNVTVGFEIDATPEKPSVAKIPRKRRKRGESPWPTEGDSG